MGDRYFLSVTCPKCGFKDDDGYYAPTCGFVDWTCPNCEYVVDLEELTGITHEMASNADALRAIVDSFSGNNAEALTRY